MNKHHTIDATLEGGKIRSLAELERDGKKP
jgi:hypothetical protein